jgi:hypothetical protein
VPVAPPVPVNGVKIDLEAKNPIFIVIIF